MRRIREYLAKRRVTTYCVITFALTWTFWFATVYPRALPLMSAGENPLSDPITVLFVGAGMFFPAIGVIITRLLTGEGFRNAWIRPVHFRQTWRYYLIGWFGPIALVAIGAAAYFVLNPGQLDTSMSSFVETARRQMGSAGQPMTMPSSQIAALGYAQLALVIVAPLLNCVSCFGEEWGWRGYLLPHLSERHGVRIAVPVSGIIWGLWHAPITVLGHNYGLGYPGWPILGILAMCCLCVALSYLFSWLTLRAKSCLPAVFAHGALNGCSAAPLMFMVGTANPFVGPAPTGIIGGIGFIVVAVLCHISLKRGQETG